MNIQEKLFSLKDEKYKIFQTKLIPNIDPNIVIGIRIPELRKLAKNLIKENNYISFLNSLPHKYYDENILHSILISEIKDYDLCIKKIEEFLPYIDNWAVCDILRPKALKNNSANLILNIKKWTKSKEPYTCRFGIETLMNNYLDNNFKKEYLKLPNIISNNYYVNMMIAWFYATSLSKNWNETIVYLENNKLNKWVHNKTIQKAIESYRIINEKKEYLRTLKIN